MNRKQLTISYHSLGIVLVGVLIGLVVSSSRNETGGTDSTWSDFNENYRIFAIPLPNDVAFAGESISLVDPEVKERYDRELLVNTYWQSNTLLFFKRSTRYFPTIERVLREEGVPEDFKYLAVIESGLQNAVSPAGASGFWQILEKTGKEYGLEINDEVDERYHVEKSTRAACKYLKAAKQKFGSWTLAAASYNMGMNGLQRQLERQKVASYNDLLLNSETARYVFRIIAVKDIMENPKQYGFRFRKDDLYPAIATKTVSIDSAITDMADFAAKFGVNYKTLKFHNPWLRQAYLKNPNKKTYRIDIPVNTEFIDEPETVVDFPSIPNDSISDH